MKEPRVVVWFSCGAASAVALDVAIRKYGKDRCVAVYCETFSEHPDNQRFLVDIENWLGVEVVRLKSKKYTDVWDVFEKTRYLVGVNGARCTTEMKKIPRRDFQEDGDIQVFGYTGEEKKRAERFAHNNPEITVDWVLIDEGIGKIECLQRLQLAGIEIPEMYKLGYHNNNCIGCVKGQAGYWNKVRVDFPDVFDRMAKVERKLNAAINKSYAGDGLRKRVFLDELDPSAGRFNDLDFSCDLLCGAEPEPDGERI